MFYEEYSSENFTMTVEKYLNSEFVQTVSAQIINPIKSYPKILESTTLSNHIEILCRCKNYEERLFYIFYITFIKSSKIFSVDFKSSFSSGEWTPRRVGPNEMMSRAGFFL